MPMQALRFDYWRTRNRGAARLVKLLTSVCMPVLCLLVVLFGLSVASYAQSQMSSIERIESMLRTQRPDQAMSLIDKGLESTPKDANLWALKGIALLMQSRDADASGAFRHALRISPQNMAALHGEAQLLARHRDPHAVPLLRRILAISPKDTTAHEMLALYEQRSGKCDAAIADFRASGPSMQKHPVSLAAYGSCLDQTGEGSQAVAVFKELAARFPALPSAKYDLALVLYKTRHYHQAAMVLHHEIADGTTDTATLSLAAEAEEAAGNTPQAVAILRRAIVANPKKVNLYDLFAQFCLDHKSYKVGIDMLNAGLSFNPNASSLHLARGILYAQLSDFSRARSDFLTAERLNPQQGISAYGVDTAELEQHQSDIKHSVATVKELRAQIHAHPESSLLHYLLAKLLSVRNQAGGKAAMAKAQKEAESAVHLKPSFVAAHDLLALIDIRLKDFPASARESRESLRYDPNDRAAVYHLIIALRRSDDPDDRNELQAMTNKLATMEKANLQESIHKKQFRLVESQPSASGGSK